MTEIKKSSYDWFQKYKGELLVTDPDGWNRENLDKSMSELITEQKFIDRCASSTCEWSNKFSEVFKKFGH